MWKKYFFYIMQKYSLYVFDYNPVKILYVFLYY